MNVTLQAEREIDDATALAATGDTLPGWFARIDERGGLAIGRRGVNAWLYGELKMDIWWVSTIANEYERARGLLEKDGKLPGYTICATKRIAADPAACYAAFTEPALLDRWFGPDNRIEAAPGGRWTNGDGNAATIKKATPGKNIRMIWDDPALGMPTPVEVKFEAVKDKSTVTVTVERLQNRTAADGYRKAWGDALVRLKTVLEA